MSFLPEDLNILTSSCLFNVKTRLQSWTSFQNPIIKIDTGNYLHGISTIWCHLNHLWPLQRPGLVLGYVHQDNSRLIFLSYKSLTDILSHVLLVTYIWCYGCSRVSPTSLISPCASSTYHIGLKLVWICWTTETNQRLSYQTICHVQRSMNSPFAKSKLSSHTPKIRLYFPRAMRSQKKWKITTKTFKNVGIIWNWNLLSNWNRPKVVLSNYMSCLAKHEKYAKANSPHILRTPGYIFHVQCVPRKGEKITTKTFKMYWCNLKLIKSTYTTCIFIVMKSLLTKWLSKLVYFKLSHDFENETVIDCFFHNKLITALSGQQVTLRR